MCEAALQLKMAHVLLGPLREGLAARLEVSQTVTGLPQLPPFHGNPENLTDDAMQTDSPRLQKAQTPISLG